MCSLIMICCRLFLEKAKGSFVLYVSSSLDARRHVSFVARLVHRDWMFVAR
jgi:hypothetical protein